MTVNLATGTATNDLGATITGTISNIQSVIGGAGATTFIADGNSDTFTGQGDGDTFKLSNGWGAVTINEPGTTGPSTATAVSNNEINIGSNNFTTGQTVVFSADPSGGIVGLTNGCLLYTSRCV